MPRKRSKKHMFFYLLPILIGLAGVLFSQQIDQLALRVLLVLVSVSVPFFAAGRLLSSYEGHRLERLFLIIGVFLLLSGAAVSVTDLGPSLAREAGIPPEVAHISGYLGMASVLLGLFVLLVGLVRTREDVETFSERFQYLAQHITEGFVLAASDGVVHLVNEQFLKMSGLLEEEVVGRHTYEIAEILDPETIRPHLEHRRQGKTTEYEVTRSVEGEERRLWFKGVPVHDSSGRHVATVVTVRDVTDYYRLTKRVERYAEGLQQLVEEQTQKLLASEERMRSLLVSMSEGFVTLDARRQIQFVNDRFCRLLKMSADALRGQDVLELVDSNSRIRFMAALSEGGRLQEPDSGFEGNFVDAQGKLAPVMVGLAFVKDPGGSEPVFSVVVTPMEEQKRLQRQLEMRAHELERVNEELRSHDRAKDSFLSNVSHELRTPLSTIQGYIEMMESGGLGEMNETQEQAVKVMRRNVERVIGHINEMLAFSRMEIHGVQVKWVLFDVNQLVDETVASAHPQALAEGVAVHSHPHEDLPPVWGDRGRLGQALTIFLNNAIKFTEKGGRIDVAVLPGVVGEVVLQVSDTGIGIEPRYQERIFDKFFQVDSSIARQYEGTGIGLSIAKSIVEAHGGRIELDSMPGEGSTFRLHLPRAIFQMQLPPESSREVDGLRVAIVHQQHSFFEVAAHGLVSCGTAVTGAADIHAAMQAAEGDPPDLFVLYQPGAEWLWREALMVLRRNPAFSAAPVLVLAPAADLEHELAPADCLLRAVPLSMRELAASVAAAVERPASGESAGFMERPEKSFMRPRVMLIDEDPDLLEWLRMALDRRRFDCICAASVQDALVRGEESPVDLVVLGVNDVPGGQTQEGLRLTRLQDILNAPLMLMSNVPNGREHRSDGVAVLHKPFTADSLADAIGNVLERSES